MCFCLKCHNLLGIREEIIGDYRGIFWYCDNKECNYKIKCSSNQISHKVYRKKCSNDDKSLNKYKVHDITLPQKRAKCPKCGVNGKKRFERKYFDNHYYINMICECEHNWKAK